jgi:uroporphyrinogen decarboxylase
MTPLERIGTVLQGGIPDRVPAAPLICGASRRVYGVTYDEWSQDGEIMAKSMLQAQDLIGFDGILGLVDLSVEAADFGQKMVFPIEDTAHPDYDDPFIKTPDDFFKIEQFDPTKSPRMKEVLKYYKMIADDRAATVAIMGFVYGPLGILSMMRGAENLFRDCYKNREAVMKAQELITPVLIDYIKAIGKTGVHAIVLDTLFASQTIMRKEMWVEIEAPFTTQLANAIRDAGMMVMVHNCGNGIYFDVQIEAMEPVAISFAYTSDDAADMHELKAKWGKKTTLCGYASPAQYAFLGTPEEMKMECKKEIEELGKDGGFILATGCEFPPNGSLMNAIAMMEAAELYGKY